VPLLANSKVMPPDPANRSSAWISVKSILFWRILKSASFALSVVGRSFTFLGTSYCRPFRVPLMIRIKNGLIFVQNNYK